MGLALVPYSIHCRSRVAARPIDALTTPSSSDDPFTFACDASGVSGPLPGFQAFATPGTLPPSVTAPHLRPLPSTGITRLLQYYRPLRHPAGPASPSRGPGSVRASPPTGLPMLLPSSPSMRASVTTPAGPKGCPRRSLPPPSSAFPISQVGRPPHCPFRGLLDVHSRSGPHVRRTALCGPLTPGCFRPYRYLHDPPWLLPTGATDVGRVSHPLEEGAFPWRTEKCRLRSRRMSEARPVGEGSPRVFRSFGGGSGA